MTYPALTLPHEILEALERGEKVTFTKDTGEPLADLVPHTPSGLKHPNRKFGTLKGHKVVIDPEWDRPQNDIDAFLRGDV